MRIGIEARWRASRACSSAPRPTSTPSSRASASATVTSRCSPNRGAPGELARLDAEIAQLRAPAEVAVPESATLDQLEVDEIGAEQDLALAQREATELQAEADGRSERRRQLPQLLAEAKARAAAP